MHGEAALHWGPRASSLERVLWQVLLFCQINITRLVIDLSSLLSYFGSYRGLINLQMPAKKAATSFKPHPQIKLFDNDIT
mgnify:CR=1 FL=1